jgi:hypothetical protein
VSQVRVIQAVFGATGGALDATAAVQRLVDSGASAVTPTTQLFGNDPAPGIVKSFAVTYQVGRTRYTAACAEGDTVTLSTAPGIVVLSAVYGAPQGSIDVTAAVQALVNAGTTTINASNTNFGDPAYGYGKQLAVTWLDATGTQQVTACAETQSVTLS